MKLVYSELKKLLPNLNVAPQQLRDDLTMIGHFANYYQDLPDSDFVVDLDIKVNRGDALGYYGLARDLSVWYRTPLSKPSPNRPLSFTNKPLPITVSSPDVRRVMSAKITGITVKPSPQWLVSLLETHGVNSINNIVDLTNYAMLVYGIPNHAFDAAKTGNGLTWENNLNQKYKEFTTLDGTTVELTDNCLLITGNKEPLCLSFIGGSNSGIDQNTHDIILEMATYSRSRVRRDSRNLKIITEAGTRLEKDLDSNLIPEAFNYLLSLILEHGEGEISTSLYDYYPHPENLPQILFNPQNPTLYSGIDIPTDFVLDCLQRLGCTQSPQESDFLITPPSIRRDINLEEDLIEEVIRFWGYQKIPTTVPLIPQELPDITPKILYLVEKLKDELVNLGYDEVRTWPLVSQPLDANTAIRTQNSINSEVTVLRQSIVESLRSQLDQYLRLKLPQPQFFEIGKVFFQKNNQYLEHYSLGLYHHNPAKLAQDLSTLNLPAKINGNFAEIILDDLQKPDYYQPQNKISSSIELTSQIITLDANVQSDLPPEEVLKTYIAKIDSDYLWQIVISDHYQNRYTLRVDYFNTDSETAKDIHFKAFGIK